VSVNEEKWLVMHVHVQLKLDELRAKLGLAHCDMKVPGQLLPFVGLDVQRCATVCILHVKLTHQVNSF
jgi:hypothetical protein